MSSDARTEGISPQSRAAASRGAKCSHPASTTERAHAMPSWAAAGPPRSWGTRQLPAASQSEPHSLSRGSRIVNARPTYNLAYARILAFTLALTLTPILALNLILTATLTPAISLQIRNRILIPTPTRVPSPTLTLTSQAPDAAQTTPHSHNCPAGHPRDSRRASECPPPCRGTTCWPTPR